MISLMCEILKKKKKRATNELTYTTEMVANVENKLTVGRG